MNKMTYFVRALDDIRNKHNQALKQLFRTGEERYLREAQNWADLEEYCLEVARGNGVYLI